MSRAALDLYSRGAANKSKGGSRVITLPGNMWSAGGKVYRSKAEAEAAAAKLADD